MNNLTNDDENLNASVIYLETIYQQENIDGVEEAAESPKEDNSGDENIIMKIVYDEEAKTFRFKRFSSPDNAENNDDEEEELLEYDEEGDNESEEYEEEFSDYDEEGDNESEEYEEEEEEEVETLNTTIVLSSDDEEMPVSHDKKIITAHLDPTPNMVDYRSVNAMSPYSSEVDEEEFLDYNGSNARYIFYFLF